MCTEITNDAISIAHNPVLNHRTKHIEADMNFIKDKIETSSTEQTTDVLS